MARSKRQTGAGGGDPIKRDPTEAEEHRPSDVSLDASSHSNVLFDLGMALLREGPAAAVAKRQEENARNFAWLIGSIDILHQVLRLKRALKADKVIPRGDGWWSFTIPGSGPGSGLVISKKIGPEDNSANLAPSREALAFLGVMMEEIKSIQNSDASNSSVDAFNLDGIFPSEGNAEADAIPLAGLHALLPDFKRGQKLIDALKNASAEEFSQIVRDPDIGARLRKAFREIEAESTDRETPEAEAAALENCGPPVPALSKAAVAAIAKRAVQKPWEEHKSEYRGRVFEFVRDTYGKWIPGLLQSHLKLDKTGLYNAFAQAISRNGLPPWLDVPSEKDAALRNTTDPDERRRMIIGRSHHRVISRRWRARLQHK